MRVGHLTTATGGPLTPATSDASGPIVLDRYRLRRRLGAGGFGTVWMARDERLERDVAVKILPRERVVEGRFEREARAAARLSHPGIVTLYEAAADDEGAYLVSELVRGPTLARALGEGRLSDRAILEIGAGLCEALGHAHVHGIVHRDVKPSNILLPGRRGSSGLSKSPAKLTDFGVARVLGGNPLTRTGDVVGTEAYMAPEQAEGREATAAADLYSLALVLYEALTGVNPVPVGAPGRPVRRLAVYLPPLRRQRRDLPRELGQALDLALRPRARERGTLEELQHALAGAADRVEDRPGVVEPPWGARQTEHQHPVPAAPAHQDLDVGVDEPVAPAPSSVALPSAPTRALAGAAAAGVAVWACGHLLAPSPLPPGLVGLLSALAVVVVPRLGWLAVTLGLAATLCAQGRPGAGFVLAAGAVLPLAVLVRRGTLWPVCALAPALGVIALAGAWPALAARARGPWRRAALGAMGWAWLWLGSALAGRALYGRLPSEASDPTAWVGSASAAAHAVLVPFFSRGLIAGAAVWALGAAVLPFARRGRRLASDVVAVVVWSLALMAGTLAASASGGLSPRPSAVMAGAIGAILLALAPWLGVAQLGGRRSASAGAGLA